MTIWLLIIWMKYFRLVRFFADNDMKGMNNNTLILNNVVLKSKTSTREEKKKHWTEDQQLLSTMLVNFSGAISICKLTAPFRVE